MSRSSSGAPGWQLEGNAPLAYDTHIVDVFLQDYSRRLVEVAAIKPGDRVLPYTCNENNKDVEHLRPNQPNLKYKHVPEPADKKPGGH